MISMSVSAVVKVGFGTYTNPQTFCRCIRVKCLTLGQHIEHHGIGFRTRLSLWHQVK